MTLQIGINRVLVPTDAEILEWRERYAEYRCIRLPEFFDARLTTWLRSRLAGAVFQERVHGGIDPPPVDLALADRSLLAMVTTIVNDSGVFKTVRAITLCDPIGCYEGIIYRMESGRNHRDTWHGDMDGNRMVTVSVNLGDPYEGGMLQIRERSSGRFVHEAANTRPGDAILFALGDDLEHRVTDVTGTTPKLALAGWFQRRPAALEALKRQGRR